MYLCKIKKGNYYVFYRGANGKRTKISTKTKYKKEALEFLTNFKKEYESKLLNSCNKTLEEFIFEYLKNISINNSDNSYKVYKTTFNYFKNYISPKTLLKDITSEQIESYLNKRASETSLYARRKDFINLKAFFNKAVNLNYIQSNPLSVIKRTKLPEKLPKYFSKSELEDLISIIDNEDYKDLIIFAFNTGMRQGELLNLKWEHIDLEKGFVIVSNTDTFTTKSKKLRRIPLNETSFEILCKRKINSTQSLVFTSNNKKFNTYRLVKKFKSWVIQSNINSKLSFHSLRHGFASSLVKNNISIFTVSKLLGHANVKTTQIYSHLTTNDLREAVNLLDTR